MYMSGSYGLGVSATLSFHHDKGDTHSLSGVLAEADGMELKPQTTFSFQHGSWKKGKTAASQWRWANIGEYRFSYKNL